MAATGFPPSKVLKLIFSNLERTDLLNNRLVCKDWNKDCLKFFNESSKFRLTLDRTNWNDYIQFVSSTAKVDPELPADPDNQQIQIPPQPVMPIHLKFMIPRRRSDYGYGSQNEEGGADKSNTEKFKEFISTVKKLQDLFASGCIRDLTFIYPRPYDEGFVENLVKILSELSPGLEKLDMGLDCDFPAKEGEEWVVFPKVKYLSFGWCTRVVTHHQHGHDVGNADNNGGNTHWKLIQACPNLETLILGVVYEEDTNHWPSELPFPPIGLKCLDLNRFPNDWLLKKMQQHPSLPKLQLQNVAGEFPLIRNVHLSEILCWREILQLFSPSLQSLRVTTPLTPPNQIRDCVHNLRFPFFPVLKKLSLWDYYDFDSSFKIDPSSFPALESLSISVNMKLNEGKSRIGIQFPSVKSLDLHFCLDHYEVYLRQLREAKVKFEHYQKMFPNIRTIAFRNDNVDEPLEYARMIKYYLNIFLQIPGASKIQVLELTDFDQNYLGEVLQQFQHPPRLVLENVRENPLLDAQLLKTFENLSCNSRSELKINHVDRSDICLTIAEQVNSSSSFKNCLTNVRKIRLTLNEDMKKILIKEAKTKKERLEYQEAVVAPKTLYLTEMMTSFPHLEEIEVPSMLFGRNGAERSQRIQKIKTKFPGLIINII